MKWKDTGESSDRQRDSAEEETFDEERYSPWADERRQQKHIKFLKMPLLLVLVVSATVALFVGLLFLVTAGKGGPADSQQLTAFEDRLRQLEERLDKFEAIDEKVTRIWEQARSFEKFKDRFDRSEASTSLRMDHLTMSLEALQKKLAQLRTPVARPKTAKKEDESSRSVESGYHIVQKGDTLYSISMKYKLKVDQLLQLNQMKPGSVIIPGQKLIVRQ